MRISYNRGELPIYVLVRHKEKNCVDTVPIPCLGFELEHLSYGSMGRRIVTIILLNGRLKSTWV